MIVKSLTLFVACSLWVSSALAQNLNDQQIAQIKSDFAGKSAADVNAALGRIRPMRVSESDKKILLKDLPLVASTNRVTDRRELARLSARLLAVLTLHDRSGVVELIVFRDSRPIIYNKPGVVVVLSTEVLKLVGDDDAALIGVVAHELAHEYVAMQTLIALRANDQAKLRRLELFCDAIAVATLLNLNLAPAGYAKVLEHICTHSQSATELNDGSGSHPALAVRLKLISEIQAQLEQRSFTKSGWRMSP